MKIKHKEGIKGLKLRRQVSCQSCGKEISISNISRHRRKAHGINGPATNDNIKSETPNTENEELVEGKTLNAEKEKQCDMCFKTFKTNKTYRRHYKEVHIQYGLTF